MESRRYYYGLDALRFAGAILVMLYHLGFYSWAPRVAPVGAIPFHKLINFTWFGWVGVEIFFVISGLVIANSMEYESAWKFARSRILRLYPAVWICASITFIAKLMVGRESHIPISALSFSYLHTLALMPNSSAWLHWIEGVYWSLEVEMGFYFLAFLGLAAMGKAWLSRLAILLVVMSSAYMAIALAHYFGAQATEGVFVFFRDHQYVTYNLAQLRYGCVFAVGILFWLLMNGMPQWWYYPSLVLGVMSSAVEIFLRSKDFIWSISVIAGQSSWVPVAAFCVFLVAIYVSTRYTSESAISYLRRIGLMTYPIYLVHYTVGISMVSFLVRHGSSKWLALIAAIAVVLAISWLVSGYLEPWLRKHFDSALRRLEAKIG